MKHVYTVQTKIIDDKNYYFVKKLMLLPEFKGLADIVVGYGMHTSFEKACDIAGLQDPVTRQKLLQDLEEQNKPQKTEKIYTVKIADSVNEWLANRGAEVLN